jgi:hypothetical protein
MKVSFLITTILALPRQDVLGLEQEKRLISTKQGHQEWMTEAQVFRFD